MGKKAGQIKAGQTLGQTNVQTPLLPLSGTRKVVRTPTNPFEAAGTVEVFVPKEIIARRIQAIFAGPNKGRKAEHYLVVWEDYPLKKDYTWEPIENLYGHEDLAQTYEQWLKTENERLDSQEAERKTERQSTAQKNQDAAADKFRKHDKMTKKTKGTNSTGKETLEVEDDEAEAAADGDDNADGSDITQDVDVLVWWRDVGQARFPRIAVMTRQFLTVPVASVTSERVFSFAGLTLSDLHKSLLEGTLETIMWVNWGSPSIPLGRGDLDMTHPELCN